MKFPEKINTKYAIIIAVISILLTSSVWYVFAATPTSTIWISSGIYPSQPSFTVWKEGSNYFAKDTNGKLASSGTNAATVIQYAINNAPNGGLVFLKCANYFLDSSITIAKSISFIGEGVYETTPTEWGGIANPDNPPSNLYGSVLRVGDDLAAIRIIGEQYSVIVKNLGIQFDTSNTREGIKIEPAAAGYGNKGLTYGEFENIAVLANNGTHYAFEFKNFQHLKCERLRSWGGPFIFIQVAESADVNYGNSVFEECYTFTNVTVPNSKAIVWISNATAATQNLMLFNRLQINSHAGNTAHSGLYLENAKYLTFIAFDIETDLHYPVKIEKESEFVSFFGGLIWSSNATSEIKVDSTSDYVSFTSMTLAVNSLDILGSNFWVETTEFKSSNSGSAEASNGDWVVHDLYTTPTSVVLAVEETDSRYSVQLYDANSTHFRVYLWDLLDGNLETVDKTINWYAEVRG